MKRNEDNIEEVLKRSLPSAPKEQMESARGRVYDYATSDKAVDLDEGDFRGQRRFGWAWIPAMTAAAVVLVSLWVGARYQERGVYAVLESPNGSMYRLVDEKLVPIAVDERIEAQEVVRSNGGSGGTLRLSDGSRVETRSETELSIERTEDGIRIRLGRGGLIVNAAKQLAGQQLYVQTKDVTVSVVGTVFLVNAEEEGSRVAVIEGEVRVTQGTEEKKLGAGEQVSTNPKLKELPVKDEIWWSKNVVEHVALLQQSTTAPPPLTFEVASVRPTASAAGGQRGTGGGGSLRPIDEPCGNPSGTNPSSTFFLQIDGRRFASHDSTLYALIGWAYGIPCPIWRGPDSVLGGPSWSKTAGFDIEATIPLGTPVYTKKQFLDGQAPELQRMLQSLLAERFQLTLRRDTREMPALVLSVPSGGHKLTEWKPGDPQTANEWIAQLGLPSEGEMYRRARELGQLDQGGFVGVKVAWPQFVELLKRSTDRPVIDRTRITSGEYTFMFQYSRSLPPSVLLTLPQGTTPIYSPTAPSLSQALEQELGLKLEAMRVPTDVLVIDRAERPSEN
jgi:uncharacterized protein (TIGR03435 family)